MSVAGECLGHYLYVTDLRPKMVSYSIRSHHHGLAACGPSFCRFWARTRVVCLQDATSRAAAPGISM